MNHKIRFVSKNTGYITTYAGNSYIDPNTGYGGLSGDGGNATLARLDSPTSVAVDSQSNVYIADTDNNRIRLVTKSTGDITTYAGGGTTLSIGDNGPAISAVLYLPYGVAVDSKGNVYIADTFN